MKILIVLMCIMLCGCGRDLKSVLYENIAEIREIMYEREDKKENVYMSFMCGQREMDYKLNGVAEELIPFGIITFKCQEDINEDINYILKTSGQDYKGILLKNPYEDNYMADVGEIVDSEYVILKAIWGNRSVELKLYRLDTGFKIKSKDIIEKVVKTYKKEINTFKKDNKFEAEVYIRIISQEYSVNSEKLWYVNIISKNGASLAIILSPISGEILSVQKNLEIT